MKKTTNLAINNLEETVTVKDVVDALATFAKKIITVRVSKNKRRETLDANLELDSPESAEEVYGEGKMSIKGKEYNIFYARRNSQNTEKYVMSPTKLYVKGVTKGEEEELTKLLGKFSITSTSPDDKPFMFIEFDTPEDQKKALDKLSENEVCGKKIHASPAYEKLVPPKRGTYKKERSE